jgi:hypothetical protein
MINKILNAPVNIHVIFIMLNGESDLFSCPVRGITATDNYTHAHLTK